MKKGLLSLFAFGLLFGAFGAVTHSEEPVEASAEVTSSKMRIWVAPSVYRSDNANVVLTFITLNSGKTISDVDKDDKRTDYTPLGAPYSKTGVWFNSKETGTWDNLSGTWRPYFYFDVPTSLVTSQYFVIERWSADASTLWNSSIGQTYISGHNSQVYYVYNDWSGGVSRGVVSSLDAGMAGVALEGFLTCEANLDNGYLNISEVEKTFIKDGTTDRVSPLTDLETTNITDYASTSDYATGKGTGVTCTAKQKWDGLLAQKAFYDANQGGGELLWVPSANKDDISSLILVFVSGFTFLGALYFISKKKMSRSN